MGALNVSTPPLATMRGRNSSAPSWHGMHKKDILEGKFGKIREQDHTDDDIRDNEKIVSEKMIALVTNRRPKLQSHTKETHTIAQHEKKQPQFSHKQSTCLDKV